MTKRKIEAWHTVMATLPRRKRTILLFMISNGGKATLREIADHLKCELHQISGRVSELHNAGILKDIGKTKYNEVSGRGMTEWHLNKEAPKKLKDALMEGLTDGFVN